MWLSSFHGIIFNAQERTPFKTLARTSRFGDLVVEVKILSSNLAFITLEMKNHMNHPHLNLGYGMTKMVESSNKEILENEINALYHGCIQELKKRNSVMRKLGFGMIGLGLFKSGDVEVQIRREINFGRHPQIYVSFADRTYNTNDAYFEPFLCHELPDDGKMMLNEKTRDWIILHMKDHHWGLSFEHNEDWK